jgi:hypothetical protein
MTACPPHMYANQHLSTVEPPPHSHT